MADEFFSASSRAGPDQAPRGYVEAIVGLATEALAGAVSEDVATLFRRTARVNAAKVSEQLTVSSSSLFIAAVLWGRANGAPSPVRGLSAAASGRGFDRVFLVGMLSDGDVDRALADLDGATPRLSDNLKKLLAEVLAATATEPSARRSESRDTPLPSDGGGVPEDPAPTVEAVLRRLFEPVISPDFERRLREAGLDPARLAEALTAFPTEGLTAAAQFVDDRPQRDHDALGRGALAFAFAYLTARVWEEQQAGRGGAHGRGRDDGAFVMHVDAPWGGGKTSFANFVTAILTQKKDEAGRAALGTRLGTLVQPADWPVASRPTGCFAGRIRRLMTGWNDDHWIEAKFNAWQNEHVLPYWWNFYLDVRKQLLKNQPRPWRAWLFVVELCWRVFSKDRVIQIVSLVLLAGALYGFFSFANPELLRELSLSKDAPTEQQSGGASQPAGSAKDAKPDTRQGVLALLLLAVAGGSGVALLASFRRGTESVIRAAADGGNAQVLGRGDPLHGLGQHFREFCKALDRPIVIVVDDLDRCQPTYVVELVRGLVTVFNAPQVVYLVLGDRRWIEACFAGAYKEMAATSANPALFGGHFAEKAMQLSFLLPAVPEERLAAYVTAMLGRTPVPGPIKSAGVAAGVARIAAARTQAGRDTALREELDAARSEAEQQLLREAAGIAAAASPEAEEEIGHYLGDLSGLMPNNARQVKRIVNMVALYQSSALATLKGYEQGGANWRRMVLWVLLMGAEPAVWRRLSDDPALAGMLGQATEPEIVAFRSTLRYAIFAGGLPKRFADTRLDAQAIKDLQALMPSRRGR